MKRIVAAIQSGIKASGLLPSFKVRERFAARFVHGTGIEVGAMHFPQKVPRGVTVKYVDYCTKEENARKFPDLPVSRIVETDYIEDGFTLGSFAESSVDFIIANHVLEHAADPVGVLLNWLRIVKPGGVVMATVPVAARCFDRGRKETTVEHLVEDHRLVAAGRLAEFRERNHAHFLEVATISVPNDIRSKGGVPDISEAKINESFAQLVAAEHADVHYHTFSIESYRRFMEHFVANFAPEAEVMAISRSRGGAEVVAVLKKPAVAADSIKYGAR